jgi:phosphoribosylaminoimidazolecarboxamide formyltransferase/IMP cyclohydrolase
MPDLVPVRRALISVSDKSGLEALGTRLAGLGVALVSTGGTARALRAAGLEVTDVAEVTGFPEMMDGRVKTLHPKIHGGLLALRDDAGHVASLTEHGIDPIDLVIIDLYPFEATVAKGAAPDEVIENIDIGGPAMIRSAAKNHRSVCVLTTPDQYDGLLAELSEKGGQTSLAFRTRMALAAYGRRRPTTRQYRTGWRDRWTNPRPTAPSAAGWPRRCAMVKTRTSAAAFYTDGSLRDPVLPRPCSIRART